MRMGDCVRMAPASLDLWDEIFDLPLAVGAEIERCEIME